MIRVTDTGSTLTVRGHANDRKHPRSEESMQACASVTALVQTLLYGIWDLGGDAPKHVIEPGNFKLDKRHLSEKSLLLVDAFILGVQAVSTGYPECVQVSKED